MPTEKITWSKNVPHALVAEHEKKGWVRTPYLDKCNHGYWAVLMEWIGKGEPPK